MVPAIFYLNLDIDDACSQANMNLCQGESGRIIAVSLRESGKAYSPGEGCRAVCAGTRADGAVFFEDCRIENGLIYCTLTTLITAFPGLVRAEIRLYGTEDVLIASPAFSISVRESAMDEGEIVQGDKATALTQMIAQAEAAIETMAASAIKDIRLSLEETGSEAAARVELIPGERGQILALSFENLKGEKGDKGDTGAQGEKGERGDTGATGATGPKGEAGDQGPQGIMGPIGPQGEKGDKGDTGPEGAQGPVGPMGPIGHDGPQGPQGEKGDKGDTGPQGPQGPQGEKGDKGEDVGLSGVDVLAALVEYGMLPGLTDKNKVIFYDSVGTVLSTY